MLTDCKQNSEFQSGFIVEFQDSTVGWLLHTTLLFAHFTDLSLNENLISNRKENNTSLTDIPPLEVVFN